MIRLLLLSALSAGLGACASANTTTATCTNLISVEGGLLQFCQTANRIEVSESGIDAAQPDREARIVDDPVTLQSIANKLHTNAKFEKSRSVVARACTVRDRNYVTVSVDDLDRITGKRSGGSEDAAR